MALAGLPPVRLSAAAEGRVRADAEQLEAAWAQGWVGDLDPIEAIADYPAPDYEYWLDRAEIDAWYDGLPLLLGHSPEHARRAPYFDRLWGDANEGRREARVATLLLERLQLAMAHHGQPFMGFGAKTGKVHRLMCSPRTILTLGERVPTIGLPDALRAGGQATKGAFHR